MSDAVLSRIAAGRTDLILEWLEGAAGSPLPIAAGASLLQWAAYYGDVSAARTLLRHGAALSELGADLGLNAAAFHGHWQLCEFLIEHGGDPTYADPATGETALHSALTHDDRMRYDLVVRVLLAAGADVHAPTKAGIETGSFMRDCRTRGESPLHRAAAFGGVETIQRLLDAGAVVTSRDAHGDSPLSWASWYRRPAEILRLLTFGPFRLHPEVLPLRANLLGKPSANT